MSNDTEADGPVRCVGAHPGQSCRESAEQGSPIPLAAFLEARLAEDEALAMRSVQVGDRGAALVSFGEPDSPPVLLVHPARVLAEVAAKRAVVALAAEQFASADAKDPRQIERSFNAGAAFAMHNTLRHLASVYSEHPDYDSAWAAVS